jgi:hypothetical protein
MSERNKTVRRLTKLEKEALEAVANDALAGDVVAFFNNGCEVSSPPRTAAERRAIKLADALISAVEKL